MWPGPQFNDLRRTNRAVQVAQRMAECPSGSLPRQMQTWKEVIALYRLLDTPEVTFEALMQPHWQHTRQEIAAHPLVLLVQDTTELDLSPHPQTTGLGQVGNERGRGLYLQTMLAVLPESGAVLGCAQHEPFVRVSAPLGERRSQRRSRSERETDVWMRLVQRLGGLAPETTLVHVGDRTADMFDFFQACGSCQTHFLVRAVQNRRTQTPDGQILWRSPAWVDTWLVAAMGHRAGRLCGRVGSTSKPCWTVYIWLLNSVGNLCIKVSHLWRGGMKGCPQTAVLLTQYFNDVVLRA